MDTHRDLKLLLITPIIITPRIALIYIIIIIIIFFTINGMHIYFNKKMLYYLVHAVVGGRIIS